MKYRKLRQFFRFIRKTPFHPQWLMSLNGNNRFLLASRYAHGLVLDIGCSGQELKKFLSGEVEYLGIDYLPTATEMYGTSPALYGEAQNLPFKEGSIDTIAILEVLEHLPNPHVVFEEMYRVLKPGGFIILTVPFLYPIHDAPYDFQRLTLFGLRALAEKSKFVIECEQVKGHAITTAALLGNLAFTKTTLDGFRNKGPYALLILLLPLIVPLFNLTGWLFNRIENKGTFMALGYTMIFKRK